MGLTADGQTAFFAVNTIAGVRVQSVDTATGAERVLPVLVPSPAVTNLIASPDGATLVVTYVDVLTDRLQSGAVATTGGAVQPTADAATDEIASSFTHKGNGVYVTRYTADRVPALHVLDLATSQVTPLRDGTSFAFAIRAYA